MIWIFAGELDTALSAATRLEPTRYLRHIGWHVTLVNACPEAETQVRGVDVLCLSTIDRYFIRQFVFHWKVMRFILKQKPPADIILFHQDSGLWIFPLIFLRNLRGEKRPLFVLDIRSVHMPDPERENIRSKVRGLYIKTVNWAANHWADGQTAVTTRIAETVDVPKDKLWGIWENGVNLEQFAPAIAARRWPVLGEPIELIYIGSMEYERNLMNFCLAVAKANSLGMNFHLILLGDGLQRSDLERFAQGTRGRVEVFPTVPYEKVVDYLGRAHLGVLPFPDEEKFRVSSPVKLFEYMAAGLVILATRIVCHTDVIGDSPCVFWVNGSGVDDFVSALTQVWKERSKLTTMSKQALLAARAYAWEASSEKLKTALELGLSKYR
jgi:glycosyltransferase involved in cell wall biosynthesis